MYRYDIHDQTLVDERVAQFRDQMERYRAGRLGEEEFRPLRLQNGLYIQRHAPMLRIAIPYGMLAGSQLRALAEITRRYDRGYGHFTTRQNLQLNWPALEDVPDILADLAKVQMHAIQTSGNCIRNTTSDQFAGIANDEVEDPRPWCELIRQWSTLHPEFAYLPRKFKIAVSGAAQDRAAIQVHDIGLRFWYNADGELRIKVLAGGGLGRTPMIADVVREDLPWQHLLTYLEACVRVYNQFGRRDNKFKARIKILVKALGIEEFRRRVDEEWAHLKDGPQTLNQAAVDAAKVHFPEPARRPVAANANEEFDRLRAENRSFARFVTNNVTDHKVPGYKAVTLSLKRREHAPGDVTADQMEAVADLADRYSFGEVRVTHEQNLVLSDVPVDELEALWEELEALGMANPTVGTLNDIICCPGGDYCSLANAVSIPIAQALQERFEDLDFLYDLGPLDLNISGCMNACGHHHVGHIGILGVDKKGEEFYQISIGGNSTDDASLGKILGPSFFRSDVPDVVEKVLEVYVSQRHEDERFLDTYRRIGLKPFKERVYA
ncbi:MULTISPECIES: nitrite/sulfite reductase [Halomonadaceae]|jgi:sulfite reductase (NADPH) hemoprotein beta-component|uniref:nitrite/sulfite reductase n=1 Tax=Halomonadaceae TaxID=28256 RepID=UPI0012F03252|nr:MULTISPECIES: nitrite/sulfite reductase [Halomonas]CAD5258455.1 Sulfite reductase (NADPH) hemoprotein beta-component [Halomonas sp. 156]CAD5290551.1 Sulfite reductase (NADPH) hemoprotein beta-component [Halomonas sp. 113]CAD5292060.1 Sulfite reductase (NADPH) hemoprotein beta-component [Halomonas sp. 59]CAD5295740.1 Sulfite reductase (NADPH) hemoprotein beta-component [Halomonas sp. I3]VXB54961.1 Sulfite reductase (NADPH) hemoprotein beta-component [Halomonas titanicae]